MRRPVFLVFRGCFARASRLAARRGETLFLLTGAVLQRVRRLYENAENRQKSSNNRSDGPARPSRAKKLDFCAPGCESTSKSIASARFRTSQGIPKKLPFFTGTLFRTLRALPGRSRGVSESLRLVPGSSLGASGFPGTLPSVILDRFWEPQDSILCALARPCRLDLAVNNSPID